jgi:hypothetical protein
MRLIGFFHQSDFDEATVKITEFESMFTNLEGVEDLNNKKNELATEMRENKKKIMDFNVRRFHSNFLRFYFADLLV